MAVLAPMPSASVSTATVVKPGFFAQHAQAEANVLCEFVQKTHAPTVAALFLYLVKAAEFDFRAPLCFFAGHPRLDVFLYLMFEVGAQFFIQFRFHRITPEQRSQSI